MATRYVALGPLLSGEGSRAFLGLRIVDGEASPCALIWVPEHVMMEPELVEQLRRDTSRAAALVHPNVVRVHGLIEVDEGLARIVEFADAESLRRIVDVSERLPPGFAARVAVDAALGVQYAHLAGNEDGSPLVHGDLRPETLLVSYFGVTKVSGYGALGVAPKEMGGKRVMGRRLHCAPEQVLGGRQAVTPQTDVYLLGLILYECLTGEIPFRGEKDFDKAVLNKQPALLNSEYIPPKLRPVVGKAMAKKGNLRFPTVQAFREAVEEAMGEIPDHAEFAAFLEKAFQADDLRAARRRELENGFNEWVIKKGLRRAPPPTPPAPSPKRVTAAPAPVVEPASVAAVAAPPPVPTPAPVAPAAAAEPPPAPLPPKAPVAAAPPPVSAPTPTPTPPAVAPPAPPRPAPVPARPVVAPVVVAGAEPPRKEGPWLLAVPVLLVVVAGAFYLGQRSTKPEPQAPKQAAAPADAPPKTAPSPELAVVDPKPAASPRVGSPDPVRPEVKVPVPAAAPLADLPALRPEIPTLEVVVDPPMTVAIDGRVMGKSPLKTEVPTGTHKVTLTDPAQGLSLVRTVSVKPGANRLSLKLGRGQVTVSAPAGAEVRIDGRVVGQAPLPGPVTVVEGSHRIQVNVNGARWQQAFTLGDNETMNFEVETHGGE